MTDIDPQRRRPFTSRALPALLVAWAAHGPVVGAAAQSPPSPVKRVVPPSDAVGEGPAPLLREGGILLDVEGSIQRHAELGVHMFHPAESGAGGVRRELVLLPSRGLEDLARIEALRSRENEPSLAGVFQVTGRVLVYRGRNFLLPESIVPLERMPDDSAAKPAPAVAIPVPPADADDDIAADIEARLESRIGAVPRSLDLADAPAVETAPIRSGTRFVDRRGHVVRDPESGVWRFVPAGGAAGTTGIVLLPCLELQRMEREARQRDVAAPLLVSGLVTSYRGRNYLLPSAVRQAEEGRGIGP